MAAGATGRPRPGQGRGPEADRHAPGQRALQLSAMSRASDGPLELIEAGSGQARPSSECRDATTAPCER